MARQRPTPRAKTRTREHVIADLALNHVERRVLLCGFTLQRIQADYGYDYVMWTYNARGEIQSGFVYFQIKATDHLPLLGDGGTISWPVSRRDLRLWLKEAYPVVLVVYDGRNDKGYWLYVQACFPEDRPSCFRRAKRSTFTFPRATGSTGGPCEGSPVSRTQSTGKCREGFITMSEPRIRFSTLRKLLLDLEFTETVVPGSHIGFRHERSDTTIMLPTYRSNEIVAPRHQMPVRTLLDEKGILAGEEFDRILASESVEQAAS